MLLDALSPHKVGDGSLHTSIDQRRVNIELRLKGMKPHAQLLFIEEVELLCHIDGQAIHCRHDCYVEH